MIYSILTFVKRKFTEDVSKQRTCIIKPATCFQAFLFVSSSILSFWRSVHTKRFREIFSVVLWCSSQYWLYVMPIWSHSLSHNSIKCLLFILKFSFHYSTMVLLFKMFVHQMFVLPAWSTPYRLLLLWRSSIKPVYKRHSNRFFDSLNAWTAIFFFE